MIRQKRSQNELQQIINNSNSKLISDEKKTIEVWIRKGSDVLSLQDSDIPGGEKCNLISVTSFTFSLDLLKNLYIYYIKSFCILELHLEFMILHWHLIHRHVSHDHAEQETYDHDRFIHNWNFHNKITNHQPWFN